MSYLSYTHMIQAVLDLYGNKKTDEAIALLKKESAFFPQRFERMTYFYHFRILSHANRLKEAIDVFETARSRGHWYPQNWLPEDDDFLENARQNEEFTELLQENLKFAREQQQETEAELYIQEPNSGSGKKPPLLIALHGNYSNAFETQDYWEAALDEKITLATPQSSQIEGKDAYVWNDFEVAEKELRDQFNVMQQDIAFDEDQVIVGGFSMGGGFAVYAVLKQIIPAKGLILAAPYIPNLDDLQTLLENLAQPSFRVYILIGKEDTGCLPQTEKLKALLEKYNIPVKYDLRENYAHTYPEDFDESLSQALQFILN